MGELVKSVFNSLVSETHSLSELPQSYREFIDENPHYPAYPNSADREATTDALIFFALFTLGLCVGGLVYFREFEGIVEMYFYKKRCQERRAGGGASGANVIWDGGDSDMGESEFSSSSSTKKVRVMTKRHLVILLSPCFVVWCWVALVTWKSYQKPNRDISGELSGSSHCYQMLIFNSLGLILVPFESYVHLFQKVTFRWSVTAGNIGLCIWGIYLSCTSSTAICTPILWWGCCTMSGILVLCILGHLSLHFMISWYKRKRERQQSVQAKENSIGNGRELPARRKSGEEEVGRVEGGLQNKFIIPDGENEYFQPQYGSFTPQQFDFVSAQNQQSHGNIPSRNGNITRSPGISYVSMGAAGVAPREANYVASKWTTGSE